MGSKEAAFLGAMDAVQEYLSLQHQLEELMRTGFLHLASARYSMGADRVSATQLPAAMAATVRLRGDKELELVKVEGGATAVAAAAPSPPSPSADSMGGSDILAELSAKYGCDFERDPGHSPEPHHVAADPLEWYGALVSPSLRSSQKDFAAALQLVAELANVRRQIIDSLAVFEQNKQ